MRTWLQLPRQNLVESGYLKSTKKIFTNKLNNKLDREFPIRSLFAVRRVVVTFISARPLRRLLWAIARARMLTVKKPGLHASTIVTLSDLDRFIQMAESMKS